jgi:hypothetical protein
MIPRIHNNQILDIWVFINLKSIVKLIKILNFSGVHHELKSNGAILIGLMWHGHLKAILIDHYMWNLLPLFFAMYPKNLPKHFHSFIWVDNILIVELICKERLTLFSSKTFKLVKLWVEFVCISNLNKIVAFSSKKSLILQVFQGKQSDWIFCFLA